MMRRICLALSVTALLVGGCAASKGESYVRLGYDFGKIEKVAVVQVSGAVRGEAVKDQIADFFNMELMKRGFVPVERSQIKALLQEQKFQASEVTTSTGAARAGQILNVPAIVLVNIPKYSDEMSITAKMIDVQDGSLLWAGSGFGRTGKGLSTFLGAALGVGAGATLAGGDSRDKLGGAIIGGVLGGVAGSAMSPQQAEQVQKVIKDVCEKLPARMVIMR